MFSNDSYFVSGGFRAWTAEPISITLKLMPAELCADTTLVVIDAQTGEWSANKEELLCALERQIKIARERGWAIVFLVTQPWRKGQVFERLTKLVEGYPRTFTRYKAFDNGAGELVDVCYDFRYPTGMFRVCGVNTDKCVQDTIKGVLKALPQAGIRVIAEACNSDTPLENSASAANQHWCWYEQRQADTPQLCVSSEAIDQEMATS